MYYAILENRVIDIQEDLQEYGPDVFGNPIVVVESEEDFPLGTFYDEKTKKFVSQNTETVSAFSFVDDEKSLDTPSDVAYNDDVTE